MLCINTQSSLLGFRKGKTLWPHVVVRKGGKEAVMRDRENGVAAHGKKGNHLHLTRWCEWAAAIYFV